MSRTARSCSVLIASVFACTCICLFTPSFAEQLASCNKARSDLTRSVIEKVKALLCDTDLHADDIRTTLMILVRTKLLLTLTFSGVVHLATCRLVRLHIHEGLPSSPRQGHVRIQTLIHY